MLLDCFRSFSAQADRPPHLVAYTPNPSQARLVSRRRAVLSFLRAASPAERRVLIAGGLGWMLDGMDVTLFALVIPAVESEFHLSGSQAGLLASITLMTSAVGGVLFGVLADR